MKKITVLMLVVSLVLSMLLVGCGNEETSSSVASEAASSEASSEATSEAASSEAASEEASADESAVSEEASKDEVKVMTYAEYAAAEKDAAVVVESYVQATQGWWTDSETGKTLTTLYLQDSEGAIFAYNAECSEENWKKISVGTKVRVTGFKGEFHGEIEVVDGVVEVLEGNYVAEATDVTAILGNADELVKKQNMFVAFKGLTVAASKDADGNEVAFLYKWNGSGTDGDDLYFNVTDGTNTYSFTVESYLCGKDTEVYAAVKALKVGDKIDAEGFLYWYDAVNPHITKVTVIAE